MIEKPVRSCDEIRIEAFLLLLVVSAREEGDCRRWATQNIRLFVRGENGNYIPLRSRQMVLKSHREEES